MNRKEYLNFREFGSYLEHLDRSSNKTKLDMNQFFTIFNRWSHAQEVYTSLLAYYDAKFTVMTLTYRDTEEVIKYY